MMQCLERAGRMLQTYRVLHSDYPELADQACAAKQFPAQAFPPVSVIGREDGLVHLQVADQRLYWPAAYGRSVLPWLYLEVFAPAECNPHAYESGAVTLTPGTWVVDAGACEGFFVRYALRRGCRVLAVEPVPALARALERTYRDEIAAGQVRVLQGALGEGTGELRVQVRRRAPDFAVVCPVGGEPVPAYTLDQLVAEGTIDSIDLIKMDIEGGEMAAMRGAAGVLRDLRPKLSIAVYHREENAARLKDLLLQAEGRYRVWYRGAWMRGLKRPRPYILLASV